MQVDGLAVELVDVEAFLRLPLEQKSLELEAYANMHIISLILTVQKGTPPHLTLTAVFNGSMLRCSYDLMEWCSHVLGVAIEWNGVPSYWAFSGTGRLHGISMAWWRRQGRFGGDLNPGVILISNPGTLSKAPGWPL